MKIDFDKVGIIASYLAENTQNLYVTKLLKLLYYIDFIAYKQRGASVTNDTYYKLPYGPVPTLIKNELDLISNNVMETEIKPQLSKYVELISDSNNFGKLVKNKMKDLNLKKVSDSELKLIKTIATTFNKTTAKRLSNQTHKEKPWLLTSENSPINYELAKELDVNKILPSFSK